MHWHACKRTSNQLHSDGVCSCAASRDGSRSVLDDAALAFAFTLSQFENPSPVKIDHEG